MDASAKPAWMLDVDAMSQEDLARKWRFAPLGDDFWQGPRGAYAKARFEELGGWSPALSKQIGL